MRFFAAFAAGLLGAMLRRSVGDPCPAECYRSIENALQFRNKKKDGAVFSQRYEPYQLGEVIPITHDTALFRFLLHADEEFNLKPCSTLQACYKYGVQPTEQCHRFYTPVTANHTKGYFDIIVKRKQGGLMTTHLFGMHVGDKLLFRSVNFKVQYRPNRWSHVGMIAGGTGFTPMLQIIRHGLMEKWKDGVVDHTKLSFLFCNRTEKHILLKGLFDDLSVRYPERFKVHYTVDQPVDPENWKHFVGYVTKEMVQQTMPAVEEENKIIMICGPDQLLNHVAGTPMETMNAMSSGVNIQPLAPDLNNLVALGGILGELGYKDSDIYRF
ncbi:reductase [Trypanosoma rangeli]|uniref:Reductase n=1 Tax=Trypanosoma rangeli TaxID=5698 RepID=A0A422NMZ5_TRYRA|nr:reductase [Trypanosoma rangeli]RNF06774.1 reductase [Trypanosoma rangeli]|eukprot:RNF06774.1 reductase [Trypanosoma rangeli]